MNSDKIRIALNKPDYINYHQLSQNSNNINIINSVIIFPALIFIFEQLKKILMTMILMTINGLEL